MQLPRILLILLSSVMALVWTACASTPPPTLPTPTIVRTEVVALPALLAAPQQWSGKPIVLIAPVQMRGDDRVLAFEPPSAEASPDQTRNMVWLADPLPPTVQEALPNKQGVIKLQGTLSPPGAYGREQRFTYQFSAKAVQVLQPERTTLANLAENPRALDQILLQVEGTLLVQSDTALLTDAVSTGGVPTAQGRQIKLPRTSITNEVVDGLKPSGDVRWGAVRLIGWWQDGTMLPLSVTPLNPGGQ